MANLFDDAFFDTVEEGMTSEVAAGPVGERDAGLDASEFTPICEVEAYEMGSTATNGSFSRATMLWLLANTALQYSALAGDSECAAAFSDLNETVLFLAIRRHGGGVQALWASY